MRGRGAAGAARHQRGGNARAARLGSTPARAMQQQTSSGAGLLAGTSGRQAHAPSASEGGQRGERLRGGRGHGEAAEGSAEVVAGVRPLRRCEAGALLGSGGKYSSSSIRRAGGRPRAWAGRRRALSKGAGAWPGMHSARGHDDGRVGREYGFGGAATTAVET
nr:uncharacterized protein LOC109735138 [Aegilops tauschii subsp. strangulata]